MIYFGWILVVWNIGILCLLAWSAIDNYHERRICLAMILYVAPTLAYILWSLLKG